MTLRERCQAVIPFREWTWELIGRGIGPCIMILALIVLIVGFAVVNLLVNHG